MMGNRQWIRRAEAKTFICKLLGKVFGVRRSSNSSNAHCTTVGFIQVDKRAVNTLIVGTQSIGESWE